MKPFLYFPSPRLFHLGLTGLIVYNYNSSLMDCWLFKVVGGIGLKGTVNLYILFAFM